MRHEHGDDGYKQKFPVKVNFSSNVRPIGLSGGEDGLQAHLRDALSGIGRYPEVAAESLTEELALQEGVSPEEAIVTNGAVDAIDRVAHLWRGRHSWIPVPTFAEYEAAALRHDHVVSFGDQGEAPGFDPPKDSIVWWCNPNNPTGAAVSRSDVLALVDARMDCVFVLDLAYAGFCTEEPVTAADSVARPNLVLIHSLTKVHAIPGLRLGYVIAAQDTIASLAESAVPWAVNSLAIEAGRYLLSEKGLTAEHRDEWLEEARRFSESLATIEGVEVRPSDAPYFLWRWTGCSAADLKGRLMRDHGLLIRDAGNFRGLDAHWARVATQSRAENNQLVEALRSCVK